MGPWCTTWLSHPPSPSPCPPAADLGNPYNRGWLGNCAEVFCTPIPPRWGQLGMRQRVEAAEAAAAEAARVQQEAMAAGMVPPGAGEVQMVPLPHAELEGGFRGSLKAADEAAAGSNGAGVEVLPYPDDEVRAGGRCVGVGLWTQSWNGCRAFTLPPLLSGLWFSAAFFCETYLGFLPCWKRVPARCRRRVAAMRGTSACLWPPAPSTRRQAPLGFRAPAVCAVGQPQQHPNSPCLPAVAAR